MVEVKKRETAYKYRINDIIRGNPIFEEKDGNKRLMFVELGEKRIVRVNIIANVVDKYESDGEKRFGSVTLDDGTGQIRARVFADDITKFSNVNQGDTLVIIGLLRYFNNELYILPEVIKKYDSKYLLIRKLELDKHNKNMAPIEKGEVKVLREEVISLIKFSEQNEGIDKEEIIMKISAQPDSINKEIQKLLEEGIIYEPKPGRVRYLG